MEPFDSKYYFSAQLRQFHQKKILEGVKNRFPINNFYHLLLKLIFFMNFVIPPTLNVEWPHNGQFVGTRGFHLATYQWLPHDIVENADKLKNTPPKYEHTNRKSYLILIF